MARRSPKKAGAEEPETVRKEQKSSGFLASLHGWQTLMAAGVAGVVAIIVAVIGLVGGNSATSSQEGTGNETPPGPTIVVTETIFDVADDGGLLLTVHGTASGLPTPHEIFAVATRPQTSTSGDDPVRWIVQRARERGEQWTADLVLPKEVQSPVSVRGVWYPVYEASCAPGADCSSDHRADLERFGPPDAEGLSPPLTVSP